ncbi:MAG: arginyl-tRNA synthetase [Candidatus Tokpelaia sp. JSC085]|nr:MAG: arginyl-tRNA synthetase [Candidatus Tokpelaia sp. JSC085]
MNVFFEFEQRIKKILHSLNIKEKEELENDLPRIFVESSRKSVHGELVTNVAMVLAKTIGENPLNLADRIAVHLHRDNDIISVEVARPGFINLRLTERFWLRTLCDMICHGTDYGRSDVGKNIRVNVEYVSANPTGPLHIGHGRGAVIGDVLSNLLRFAGYDVTKEYYINDAGKQVDVLAQSVLLRYREALGEEIEIPAGFYPGDYLIPVSKMLIDEFGGRLLLLDEDQVLPIVKERAISAMMHLICRDLAMLNIHHDLFFSECALYVDHGKAIRDAIDNLAFRGHIYSGKLPPPKGQMFDAWEDREQTLLRSTAVGDDMDRPLTKSDGSYTYFAADIAYFKNKYDRGFQEIIYVLGADHSGYVKRLQAVAKAVSDSHVKLQVLLCQLVRLYRDGEPVRMGKRTGHFISLREVVSEVGCDPVRFMMLYRKYDAPLDFDFAKVTEQSRDNPVFYVQYANARCHSIFRQACKTMQIGELNRNDFITHVGRLGDESELLLIRKLAEYPRLIETAAMNQEPHRLAFYLYDLASMFHAHWNKGNEDLALRFIHLTDQGLTLARLGLVQAVADVITSGLSIIGVEAPDEMRN